MRRLPERGSNRSSSDSSRTNPHSLTYHHQNDQHHHHQNPLIRTAQLLGVLEQLLDAIDTTEKETRVIISEQYDPELLQLCTEVEEAMTTCVAIPALESFVNTEGVASLIEGHRLVVEATAPGKATIVKKGLKSRLQQLDPSFVPPAPSCHYHDLEVAYFQTKAQEQALTTMEKFYLPSIEESLEDLPSSCLPSSSCLACHTLFAVMQTLAKKILFLRDLWEQPEESRHETLPVNRHLLKSSAEVVAAISNTCLCSTEEARQFKTDVLIKDISFLFLPLVSESLRHAKRYAADLFSWRNHLAEFHQDRCGELRQLGDWYRKSLEANTMWESEEKRRRAFKARFHSQVEALQLAMSEEQQMRTNFLQRHGAHLPIEGYPNAVRPLTPVQIEVLFQEGDQKPEQ